MGELEDLIEEQRRDQKMGHRQYREPFVSISIDQIAFQSESGGIPFSNLVWEDNLRLSSQSKIRSWGGCPIHGRGTMRYLPSGKLYCRECNVKNQQELRRAKGIKPRNWCPHGGPDRITKAGNKYCSLCMTIRNQARFKNDSG